MFSVTVLLRVNAVQQFWTAEEMNKVTEAFREG
jgi:hypothetical protein